jgi:anaerobic carbon-monoxide dehydrogenase, CODH/ACS complex subunit alpha
VAKTERQNNEAREFIRAGDAWEPIGHTPVPGMLDLRSWDLRLLQTWKPLYVPVTDKCNLCTYGECDLSEGKKGSCSMDAQAMQARLTLQACCEGLARSIAGARRVVHYVIDTKGGDLKLELGEKVAIEAPHIRTVIGLKPETMGDLPAVLAYLEHQLAFLLAAANTGMEVSSLEFESRAMQAGMLSHVAMEAAEIAGIAGLGFPSSEADTPMVDVGWASVDRSKAVILVAGNDTVSAVCLVDYLRNARLEDQVEVVGVGPVAHDLARYSSRARIAGPLSRLLFFLRCGIADVVMCGGGNMLTDIVKEASSTGTGFIATDARAVYGLQDATAENSEEIASDLQKGMARLVLEPRKAAAVAVEAALKLSATRRKELLTPEEVAAMAAGVKTARPCEDACPNKLPITGAVEAASHNDFNLFAEVYEKCIGCGKCEIAVNGEVPVLRMMQAAARKESGKMRSGRGPVMDTEIRKVGAPLVLGNIPGVIAIVGGSNYPASPDDIADIAEEFARRKYIVVLAGDSAIAAAIKKDADGKTVYEKYPPEFDAGCIINMGPGFAASHISGAAIKIASIFAALPLRANYEVVADYILNRVGACGLAWGASGEEELALATGCNRLGIPVIVGPHCIKYARLYISRGAETSWSVMDGREKKLVDTGEPSPEHLLNLLGDKGAAMVALARLCMRKNDTPQGRATKLTHYIGLHKQFAGKLPDDAHLFIRRSSDIPIFFKKELQAKLNELGWTEKPVMSLPTLIGTYPSSVSLDEVVH